MSHLVADTYEIKQQIGAGGGGIVYLGYHVRLDKPIVLKADKRKLTTKMDALKREVNMLKDLSHTYIPQVYDFVQEDESVYTVMDYIEGESFDKLLAQNVRFTQPQIIKWARQLLEALEYLHTRPPHGILHGDIKPANIMLKPDGDICLIDFNIALALGEDGAVKVGFSRGYASPEHYGAEYIMGKRMAEGVSISVTSTGKNEPVIKFDPDETRYENVYMESDPDATAYEDETTDYDPDETSYKEVIMDNIVNADSEYEKKSFSNNVQTPTSSKGVLLDARSDLYSLGATLYHMISGVKPPQNAAEVIPLGTDVCSKAVSDIIKKAMEPLPENRFQSAKEMLEAFLNLKKNDPRMIRYRRKVKTAVAFTTSLFLLGGAGAFIGLKQKEQRQSAIVLSEYSADALDKGEVSNAVKYALDAIPKKGDFLAAEVTPQAQLALTNALGVYELADEFQAYDVIDLPSAPFDIALSPNGSKVAVVCSNKIIVYELDGKEKMADLATEPSALSDVVFVDDDTIVYAGDQGITAYSLSEGKILWAGEKATNIAISKDRKIVAAVNRDAAHAVVYKAGDGICMGKCSFGERHLKVAANDIFADPKDYIFELNGNGSLLAVSFSNGELCIFDLADPEGELLIFDEPDYITFSGGFYEDYFAFSAGNSTGSIFGLVDMQKAVYVGEYGSQNPILVKTDENGIYVAEQNLLVTMNMKNEMEEQELAYTNSVGITDFSIGNEFIIIALEDNSFVFYDFNANQRSIMDSVEKCEFVLIQGRYALTANRTEKSIRLLKLEKHEDAELLKYDGRYAHDEARISEDGKRAMLFGYQGFRIYDFSGNLLAEQEIPDPEKIYDQQFRRENGKSFLEVIWYDGLIRRYSDVDGTLLNEEKGILPEKDLYEEFYTDQYRIASSLHDAAIVYERDSDKQIGLLEKDAYLTYVTQMDDCLITEYVNAEGKRFGIILDNRLRKLAYLPQLCDVRGANLVFDDCSGTLRQCRIYSLGELIALGESY